jgi:hypothetical protein
LPKKRFGSSKGVSTVIGTIFLVVAVFALSTNIFLWTITRNALYNQAVKESHQMDADRFSERIATSRADFTMPQPGIVQVDVTVFNEGPISAQVITAWVLWTVGGETKYGVNNTLSISLNPGETLPVTIRVGIPGVSSAGAFSGWLVTARGNQVSLEKEKIVVHAQVAEGIGSVMMDFETFKYYVVEGGVLKNPTSGFEVKAGSDIVFAVFLSNYDLDKRTIKLDSRSLLWVYYPDQAASDVWKIVKVESGTIAPYSPITLAYSESKWIFFGPAKTSFKGRSGAVNLLLLGEIGSDEDGWVKYGQNIPFVSIYVTG